MEIIASGPIRAMYFIQQKTIGHAGNVKYDLGAVIPNYGEEDESPASGFHQSTPSGDAHLNYHIGHDPEWEPDTRLLLLFDPIRGDVDPGEVWWALWERREYERSIVTFFLEPRGKDRPFSWDTKLHLDVDTSFTKADFGRPGQRFLLKFEKVKK